MSPIPWASRYEPPRVDYLNAPDFQILDLSRFLPPFAGLGQIHSLKLTGMSNHVYWDDLTVTVVPEPTALSLSLACLLVCVRRIKMQTGAAHEHSIQSSATGDSASNAIAPLPRNNQARALQGNGQLSTAIAMAIPLSLIT